MKGTLAADEITDLFEFVIERIRQLGGQIPQASAEVWVREGDTRSSYGFDIINYAPHALEPICPVCTAFHEMGHWYAGFDSRVDRILADTFAAYFNYCVDRNLEWIAVACHTTKEIRSISSVMITDSLSESKGTGKKYTEIRVAFAQFLLERLGEDGFWDAYYSLDPPFERIFGKNFDALVEDDFSCWLNENDFLAKPGTRGDGANNASVEDPTPTPKECPLIKWPPGLPENLPALEEWIKAHNGQERRKGIEE
jgi:hypothetical protein